jgi:hypothetical protein
MTLERKVTWLKKGLVIIQHWDHFAKVGDRVAVVRKETGVLNFFVNGEDQGPAATNVPERVYGVIDLYGQAAQAKENLPLRRRQKQKSANRRQKIRKSKTKNPQIEDKKSANRRQKIRKSILLTK